MMVLQSEDDEAHAMGIVLCTFVMPVLMIFVTIGELLGLK